MLTETDIARLIEHVRTGPDRALTLGGDPERTVRAVLAASLCLWTWRHDGEIGAVIGAVSESLFAARAYVWALTTPLVETHPRAFARWAFRLRQPLLDTFAELHGHVQTDDPHLCRWLRFHRAEIGAVQLLGGVPFHPFVIRRSA